MSKNTQPNSEVDTRPQGKPWGPAEFAAFCGISTKHLRYLMDTNKVASIRIGRRKRLIPDHEAKRVFREGV
jgi:hypothetical protein